jgi:hypothetical protein
LGLVSYIRPGVEEFTMDLRTLIFSVPLALIGAGAHAATVTNEGMPSTDPLAEMESMYQPRDQFSLYSENDVDLVRFKQDHLVSICVPHENHDQIGATAHAVGLVVKFDGDTDTIPPGSCFSMEARRLSVKPDGPVGQNNVLTGTIRIVR